MEQLIFRIKNKAGGGYWNGNGFGSGGKIYTKRKFANATMTDGKLGNMLESGTYDKEKVVIVKALITGEEEVG